MGSRFVIISAAVNGCGSAKCTAARSARPTSPSAAVACPTNNSLLGCRVSCRASQARSASVLRNSSTTESTAGSTSRRSRSAREVPGQRAAGVGSTQHRAERRIRPLAGHSRVKDQQRRAVAPILPPQRAPVRVRDVGRCRHQDVGEFDQSPPVAGLIFEANTVHGTVASRAVGATNSAGRGERGVLGDQLPSRRGDQMLTDDVGQFLFGGRVRERACGDGTFDRLAGAFRRFGVGQCVGQ